MMMKRRKTWLLRRWSSKNTNWRRMWKLNYNDELKPKVQPSGD
jgi:hypothetical protein